MSKVTHDQNIGTWEAWTYPGDLIPHIYVKGEVPISEEKPIFKLKVAYPQGLNEKQLILDLEPDNINPKGNLSAPVEEFSEKMLTVKYYSVLIRTQSMSQVAIVPVIEKKR